MAGARMRGWLEMRSGLGAETDGPLRQELSFTTQQSFLVARSAFISLKVAIILVKAL